MPIPAVIKTQLSQNNIAFSATEILSRPELCCDVRSTIFQDGDKNLQVIFRADSILDVAVLCQLTQRQLKVATPASLQSICEKLNLDQITSVPKILEIDLIVDQRLLDLASLTFDSGSKDALVTITQQQSQRTACLKSSIASNNFKSLLATPRSGHLLCWSRRSKSHRLMR